MHLVPSPYLERVVNRGRGTVSQRGVKNRQQMERVLKDEARARIVNVYSFEKTTSQFAIPPDCWPCVPEIDATDFLARHVRIQKLVITIAKIINKPCLREAFNRWKWWGLCSRARYAFFDGEHEHAILVADEHEDDAIRESDGEHEHAILVADEHEDDAIRESDDDISMMMTSDEGAITPASDVPASGFDNHTRVGARRGRAPEQEDLENNCFCLTIAVCLQHWGCLT